MKKLIFILTIILMLLCSCFDSGSHPCKTGIRLQLSYAERSGENFIAIEDINQLDIFVYDKEGIYLQRIDLSSMKQVDGYILTFDIPTGEYNFTLWIGAKDEYYTISGIEPGVSTVDDGRLMLKRTADGVVPEPPSQLRYNRRNGVIVPEEGESLIQVPMQRYTSNIRVLMRGLPDDEAGYSFTITDNNGITRMSDLAIMSDEEITYLARPTSLTRAETLAGIFTVMRLAEGRHPMLNLYDGTVLRNSWDLIDEILMKYPEAGFSHGNDYEIIFTFNGDGYVAFSITVNGWEIAEEGID